MNRYAANRKYWHEHVWIRKEYGPGGWALYECQCGERTWGFYNPDTKKFYTPMTTGVRNANLDDYMSD